MREALLAILSLTFGVLGAVVYCLFIVLNSINRRLNLLISLTHTEIRLEKDMAGEVDRITAGVADLNTLADGMETTLENLAQLIRDSAGNPAALNALADSIEADNAKIRAAIVANTPAANTP